MLPVTESDIRNQKCFAQRRHFQSHNASLGRWPQSIDIVSISVSILHQHCIDIAVNSHIGESWHLVKCLECRPTILLQFYVPLWLSLLSLNQDFRFVLQLSPHVRNGYQVNDKRNLKKIDVNPAMGKNPIQVGWVWWGRGDGLVIPLANQGLIL